MRMSLMVGRFLICLGLLVGASSFASGQAYDPLYGPSSSQGLYVYCWDDYYQYVIPYCDVWSTIDFYANTNAHTHSGYGAPESTVDLPYLNTGYSGSVGVNLTLSNAGRAEWWDLWIPVWGSNIYNYAVGYEGLYRLADLVQGVWTLTGATTEHGSSVEYNHWMAYDAAQGLYAATLDYQSQHPGSVLVNDASLPLGGKFDINGSWSGDHVSHLWGKDVDINGTLDSFMENCTAHGATYTLKHGPGNLHCRWP